MGKLNLSRSEVIFCGIMLLGAAGFGIHRLGQAIYKMQEPQIFEEATRTVAPGETLSLTYREVGQQHNSVPWNGTVEMTIQKVALYPSYADAHAAEKNVTNPNGLLNDSIKDNPFLVVEVAVKNIDAEEGDFTWRYANVTGISGSDGAITLQQLFDLYSDTPIDDNGQYLASSLWCVDGESSSEYSAEAVLPQGETALITLGFTLENGAEEHLDEMSLIYRSIFGRLAIGSPTLGGETDEAV